MTQYDAREINKSNAYELLKEFAKEYKHQMGRTPIEIIIVGGGSVMLNYSFREMTQDIDVYYPISADIKNVISRVSDKLSLDAHWMNSDFRNTDSYSPKLAQYSKHYCSFNNGTVEFRTINDEYLIAMKIMAMRPYRNDYSDIVGILYENQQNNNSIPYNKIEKALFNLYDPTKLDKIQPDTLLKIKHLCELSKEDLYEEYKKEHYIEQHIHNELIQIEANNKNIITEENVDSITNDIRNNIMCDNLSTDLEDEYDFDEGDFDPGDDL